MKIGKLIETSERTEKWAWKHKHHDGSIDYVEVKGNIEMHDVDFGYNEDKINNDNKSIK